MNRRFSFFLIGLFCWATISAQQGAITLEDIWQDNTFSSNRIPGFNFLNDGVHYTRLESNNIQQYDLRNGKLVATLLEGSKLSTLSGRIKGYSFSDNESKIILSSQKESIYRHSYKANFHIYDRETAELTPVFEQGKQRLAALNPQGNKVAFVHNNNLYIKDLNENIVKQITTDGQANHIINGATDWVYEEEFGDDNGFFWSPDGQQIAFYRFDETAVEEFTMTNYRDDMYPEYVSFKYPKVGEKNSEVSLHIYDLPSRQTTEIAKTDDNWEYFPRIKWTNTPGQLCVFFMNRHQNELELRIMNAQGRSRTLLSETSDSYVDIHDNLHFLSNNDQFIWTSEIDGWNHVYLYNMNGKLVEQLTSGQWEVTSFYGLDEANGQLYYQAAKNNPMQREIYTQSLQGKDNPRGLAEQVGTNSAQFSSTFEYFVHNYSSINSPTIYTVRNRNGKEVRVIEDNADLVDRMATFNISDATFFDFKTSEDVELYGYMIKPPNFNPARKYPVLMYVYGGPGSQTVKNGWLGQNYWWFQMLAQQGYVVVSVDNRGTGARGEAFKKMTYQELGKYETMDQIEAAKYLGSQPYVDANRIGIFGWSYGGYMSSLCILKGNDVFKAAIAVAPVTNWKWYDSVYTERYMRTTTDNESGYLDNSPVYFADRLEGDYLLVHGMSDDNVHFQHTAEMANALIMENKQFDTYFYPNRNHGISGGPTRLHLYTKMTNFLNNSLKPRQVTSRARNSVRVSPVQKSRN